MHEYPAAEGLSKTKSPSTYSTHIRDSRYKVELLPNIRRISWPSPQRTEVGRYLFHEARRRSLAMITKEEAALRRGMVGGTATVADADAERGGSV